MTDWEKLEHFKKAFGAWFEGKPGAESIDYRGSTLESRRWTAGKSDLDILVIGSGIPGDVKIEGILLIEELNSRFGLALHRVPLLHPTPLYIDSPGRRFLAQVAPTAQAFTDPIRSFMKTIPPPLTHEMWWQVVRQLPPGLQQFL
jgi:hypothetical protein